jgi:hypothetical protein
VLDIVLDVSIIVPDVLVHVELLVQEDVAVLVVEDAHKVVLKLVQQDLGQIML